MIKCMCVKVAGGKWEEGVINFFVTYLGGGGRKKYLLKLGVITILATKNNVLTPSRPTPAPDNK